MREEKTTTNPVNRQVEPYRTEVSNVTWLHVVG